MSNIYTRVIPAVTQTVQAFRYTEVGVIPEGLQEACQDRMILSTRDFVHGKLLKTPRLWFWADGETDETVDVGDWIVVEQISMYTGTGRNAKIYGYEPGIDCWTDTAFRGA